MNELQGRPQRVEGRTRFQGQAADGSSAWKFNPCTPESRKHWRRNPLEVLKSQEFVGGRVGTNFGSWCAESRSLSGNSHEKKRKKEISTFGIFFGSDEKKNVCRNLMSKRKEKTHIPWTFRNRLFWQQNNYQAKGLLGAAGQMNALQLEVSTLLHHTKVLWLLWL